MRARFKLVFLSLFVVSALFFSCENPSGGGDSGGGGGGGETAVQAPVFSLVSGTYTSVQTLTLSSSTPGATIRYTTDGAAPSQTTGNIYNSTINVAVTMTVKAIAYKDGMTSSAVASQTYTINLPPSYAPTPSASVNSGLFDNEVNNVTLTSSGDVDEIKYTIDGSDPSDSNGHVYGSALAFDGTTVLKIRSFKTGKEPSPVVTYNYSFKVAVVACDLASGSYSDQQTATLSTITTNAAIWYTVDGSTPTPGSGTSVLYSDPVTVSGPMTFKAIAVKVNYSDSVELTRIYNFKVAAITASLASGTYSNDQTTTLSCPTAGAVIWYTTDGTLPTAGGGTSMQYSSAIPINRSMTLNAVGVKDSWVNSDLLSRGYLFRVASVTASLAAGTYAYDQTTTLSTMTTDADIWYTTDGSSPGVGTGTSTKFTAAVAIGASLTLKAIAVKTGYLNSSPSLSNTYKIQFPQYKNFHAQKVVPSVWYTVPSTRRAEGNHCVVYVENAQLNNVSESTAQAVCNKFDNNIIDMMHSKFGTECDLDANGKVVFLLLDIVDGYSGSGGYVAGYFDPTHEFSKATYLNSNETDMLFMDVNPSAVASDEFYSTMTHEFQHLINFANTYMVNGVQQDVWINEGLSSGSEYLYAGSQNTNRIDWYNADPVQSIKKGNNFFVWNGPWEKVNSNSVLDNYATVYLFFQWLQLHASNTTGIYKDILSSTYRDYRAVTSAAAARIDSSFGTWSTLMKTWHEANLLCQATGFKGYKGQITLTAGVYTAGGGYTYLSPGEGIFSQTSGGTFTPAAGSGVNVRYYGITMLSGEEDNASPYAGDVVLTFNANSSIGGLDEKGYKPNVQYALSVYNVIRSVPLVNPIKTSYRVDVLLSPSGQVTNPVSEMLGKGVDLFDRTNVTPRVVP